MSGSHTPYIQLWLDDRSSLSLERMLESESTLAEVLLGVAHAVESAEGEDSEPGGDRGEF
jgi:hypothetical protein